MQRLRTIARAVAAGLGVAVYVWFAAVRSLGEVKRRKAALRLRRRRARSA